MSYVGEWDDDNNNANVEQRCYGFGYSVSFACYVGELRLRNKKKAAASVANPWFEQKYSHMQIMSRYTLVIIRR